jgi:hypothetical protein
MESKGDHLGPREVVSAQIPLMIAESSRIPRCLWMKLLHPLFTGAELLTVTLHRLS